MSMSIDSMASMLNTTNTDATTNYNANALKKSLNGVSSEYFIGLFRGTIKRCHQRF